MILSRVCEVPESRTNEQFHLFKPLLLIALAVCFFELLPIDFQHAIAPQLVSYEEVFKADNRQFELPSATFEEVAVNTNVLERFSLKPTTLMIRN